MSSVSTPVRGNRENRLPGLDSKLYLDTAATTFTYGGLNTPPNSAHDSRRSSMQYLQRCDSAVYNNSDVSPFSLPSTPVHDVTPSCKVSFTGYWNDCRIALPGPAMARVHSSFPKMECHQQNAMQVVSDSFSNDNAGNLATLIDTPGQPSSAWSLTDVLSDAYTDAASDPENVFPLHYGLSSSHPTCLAGVGDVKPHCNNISSLEQFQVAPTTTLQPPRIIVPSQLCTNNDYSASPRQGNNSDNHLDVFSSSFNSSITDFTNCELLSQPTPSTEVSSFTKTDDDFFHTDCSSSSTDWPSASRGSSTQPSYAVQKRAVHKRRRKAISGINGKTFNKYTSYYNIDCRFEGKRFHFKGDPATGIKWFAEEAFNTEKAHRCCHLVESGERCGVGFDRSEHLKRHIESRHSDQRKFTCPVPGCIDKNGNQRRIGRSDNAADHFKTHLRVKDKGRRNCYVPWTTMRNLLEEHAGKRANKMVDGLQHWVDLGMPEAGALKKRH